MESRWLVLDTADIYESLPISRLAFACDICGNDEGSHLCIPRLLEELEDNDELLDTLEGYLYDR